MIESSYGPIWYQAPYGHYLDNGHILDWTGSFHIFISASFTKDRLLFLLIWLPTSDSLNSGTTFIRPITYLLIVLSLLTTFQLLHFWCYDRDAKDSLTYRLWLRYVRSTISHGLIKLLVSPVVVRTGVCRCCGRNESMWLIPRIVVLGFTVQGELQSSPSNV